ncbi:MAG TPA: hypothetical protein VHA77_08040 [Xanthobacteraceae bacterium]|jgi:hypothetical protein|nr:hypothetical protein [Xanthobacteraceae bacterium]
MGPQETSAGAPTAQTPQGGAARTHRGNTRAAGWNVVHVVLVCLCLALLIVTGVFIGVPVLSVPPLIGSIDGERAAELRNGKILLPQSDDTCRRMLFDNYTGLLREDQSRPCVERPNRPDLSRRPPHGFIWGR